MDIEKNIFKRYKLIKEKLEPFGFNKLDNGYVYKENIMDNTFQINVFIEDDGVVTTQIIDLSFNEEYTNHLVKENNGEFVNTVRKELEKVLINIRSGCYQSEMFNYEQSNRIANKIIERYGIFPNYPWKKYPQYGVFKNPQNDKWFAIIMNIERNKISDQLGEVEILNVKLTKENILRLQNQKGFYKAYHMNKNNWLTIVLDDTLSDEIILECVKESYSLTMQNEEWIIPANLKYYDIISEFKKANTIYWHQSANMKVLDFVYIYITAPTRAILYKCQIIETDLYGVYDDEKKRKQMKLKLIQEYPRDKYTIDILESFDLKSVRGARRMPKKLSEFIKENEKESSN